MDGVAGDIELHAGSDGRSTHGSSITLSPLHASLVGGIGDGNSQPAGGNVGIVGGSSTMSAGGSITLEGGDSSTDARTSEKGGSVSVSAGDGYLGGDIVLTPGHGTKENNGVFEVKTPSGHRRILSSESDISISSGDEGGIFFTTNGTDRENNVVGFGMASPTSEDLLASDNGGYDFRLQSMGTDNPTVLSTAPMQVTSVHYAADSRIKEDVVDVDVDDILQRIQRIDYKEYAYTDDWKKVRRLSSDLRVRGIIAEQLATVFPEHVEIIDNYSLPDKGFGMRGFHQVDHTGLTIDLIGALQAHYSHFLVTSNSPAQSGNVVVSSANRSSNEGPDTKYSASGNVTLMSGPAISASGSVEISTGHTSDGKAGRVDIAVGQGSLSSRASSLNLSALDVSLNGGTSNVPENGDLPGVTISILAGSATNDAANGGSIFAMTGAGPDTSGSATIKTHDLSSRNLNAESGSLSIASGSVENGQSGIVSLSTGSSMAGQAGKISITTGSSDSGSGASIFLIAGNSSEHGRPSGDVNVIGGNSFGYGSRGGMVNLHGGNGSETGGPVHISSGYSPWLSSGEILLDTANSGEVGNSGGISLKTGNAVEGETGTITLSSGSFASSASGAIHLSAGTAGKGNGGLALLAAGNSSDCRGGSIDIHSGSGSTGGGEVRILSGDALEGGSGDAVISSGVTHAGSSGRILLASGDATGGTGGGIEVTVGEGDSGNGGEVILGAENTKARGGKGGRVRITAGSSFSHSFFTDKSDSGDITLDAGYSSESVGGNILLSSGGSDKSSSGQLVLHTADAGLKGPSGSIDILTGTSTNGDT